MIINLTQHASTPDQRAAGVVDLGGAELSSLRASLTFSTLPDRAEVERRAEAVATLAAEWFEAAYERAAAVESVGGPLAPDIQAPAAMIGGAPYLMGPLCEALRERGITPLYSYTERVSEEEATPEGGLRKVTVFRHLGWVRG